MQIDITTCGQLCHALRERAQSDPLNIVIDEVVFVGSAEVCSYDGGLVLSLKSEGMGKLGDGGKGFVFADMTGAKPVVDD